MTTVSKYGKMHAEYTISQRKCNNTPVVKLLKPYIMGQNV
jgi:hypothetical protein